MLRVPAVLSHNFFEKIFTMFVEGLDPSLDVVEASLEFFNSQFEVVVLNKLFVAHLEDARDLVNIVLLFCLAVKSCFDLAELLAGVKFGWIPRKVALVIEDLLQAFKTWSESLL